ncbi:MAG: hypothetical protein ACO1O3_00960, partial [Sphingobium sp.]
MAGPAINDIDMLGYGMPISVFENRFDEPIVFSLEPHDERHELPPLARIGVRYSFGPDQMDRTFADVGRNEIRFWCDSEHREVEIIYPNAFDLLLYDICVKGGFCGGLVNDQPSHVTHLLPTTGIVTAEEFATLVLRAEGDEGSQPANVERWSERLQSQFVARMGRSSVPATELAQNLA